MGQIGPMTAHFNLHTTGLRINGCITNGAVYHTAPFSLIGPGFVKVNAYRKIKDDRDFLHNLQYDAASAACSLVERRNDWQQ